MKTSIYFIPSLMIIGLFISCQSSTNPSDTRSGMNSDSLNTQIFLDHFKENFDDIHDVSMRFHHYDPTLTGVIEINMIWENGLLKSSEIIRNETGNDDFATDLQAAIKKWEIVNLHGHFELSLPLRIKLVGSDDPSFSEKAIFTGLVINEAGHPVPHAQITFISTYSPSEVIEPCHSNREGIFVKTLIPEGKWNISITCTGYKGKHLNDVSFKTGEHTRMEIILEKE